MLLEWMRVETLHYQSQMYHSPQPIHTIYHYSKMEIGMRQYSHDFHLHQWNQDDLQIQEMDEGNIL